MNHETSSYLMHHGVKGMKWGVRKQKDRVQTSRTDRKLSSKQKKAIAIASIGVAVSVGAVVTNRYLKRYGNTTIKAGKEFQHMSRQAQALLDRPFYASHLKKDNKKYANTEFFGVHWNYRNTLKSTKDIKVAGKRISEKTYVEWVRSNKDMQAKLKKLKPGLDLKDSKSIRKTYDSFNRNFNSPDVRDRQLRDSYLSELKRRGFGAVRDRNDQIHSGMTSPIFVFDHLSDIEVKHLSKSKKH